MRWRPPATRGGSARAATRRSSRSRVSAGRTTAERPTGARSWRDPPTSSRRRRHWPESAARDAVISIVGEATLGELVRVRQVRRKRDYAADGTVVELSVDDVEVVMGDRVIERFAELEVELRQGDEAALEPLVDLLSEIEELVPAETSKLERAMEAVRREAEPGDGEPDEPRRRARDGRPDGGVAGIPVMDLAADATGRPHRMPGDTPRPRRTRAAPSRVTPARGGCRARGGRRACPGTAAHHRPQDTRGPRGRPPGRGRPQGPALPPGPDDHPRARHPRRQGRGGAARDARRHPPPAGGVAGLR